MKSLLFSIPLVILSFQPLLSQNYHPFPDSNATWCDERVDNGWPANYFYYFYKTDGKSAINDTVYTKISDNYNQTTFYLREENKMVFCRLNPGESEFVLYDFDINPGEQPAQFETINKGINKGKAAAFSAHRTSDKADYIGLIKHS